MSDLASLMALWARAWALSRGVGPPEPVAGGGWRTEVGLPNQLRRFMFCDCAPEVLRPLANSIHEPFVFLKVCTDAPTLRAALPPVWQVRQLGYMMVDYAPVRPVAAPDGYRLRTSFEPCLVRVEITAPDGDLAASGSAVLMDGVAVYDRIRTQDAHQRRGLGLAMMGALKIAAAEAGAQYGALSATMMGRELYLALGWEVVSDYSTAASPGTEPFP